MKDRSHESQYANVSVEKQLKVCNALRGKLSDATTELMQQLPKSTHANKDQIISAHSRNIVQLAKILYDSQYEICRIIKERRKNGEATLELTKLINQAYRQLEDQAKIIDMVPSIIKSNTNLHADIAKKDTPLFYALRIESFKNRFNHLKDSLEPLRELQIKDLDTYILHLTTKKMSMSVAGSNTSESELKEIIHVITDLEELRAQKIIDESIMKLNPVMLEVQISKLSKELQSLESVKESIESSDYVSIKNTITNRLSKFETALEKIQQIKLTKHMEEYAHSSTAQTEKERSAHKIIQQDGDPKATVKLRRANITSLQHPPKPPLSTAVPKKNTAPTPDIKHTHRQP